MYNIYTIPLLILILCCLLRVFGLTLSNSVISDSDIHYFIFICINYIIAFHVITFLYTYFLNQNSIKYLLREIVFPQNTRQNI